jgi:flagellar hook-basal body complex protein FliE
MLSSVANAIAAYSQPLKTQGANAATSSTGTGSFADTLSSFVGDAVDSMKESEQLAQSAATGKANLQEVVVAVSNAEVMMQTVTAIRDKVISAYQDVMRTAI